MGACFGAYPPGYNFVPGGWEGNDKKPTLRACAAAHKEGSAMDVGLTAIVIISLIDCDILCHDDPLHLLQSLTMESVHLPP